MRGLIVEGVTGAGKTQTLDALLRLDPRPSWLRDAVVYREDRTLGEFMDEELQDATLDDQARCWRLRELLTEIEASGRDFVLERFHPTYYAFMPHWHLYDEVDLRLLRLGCRMALMLVPEGQVDVRSLHRVDRIETDWVKEMVDSFGSERAVLDAVLDSQRRRQECLAHVRLPTVQIDTTARDWTGYARSIAETWT